MAFWTEERKPLGVLLAVAASLGILAGTGIGIGLGFVTIYSSVPLIAGITVLAASAFPPGIAVVIGIGAALAITAIIFGIGAYILKRGQNNQENNPERRKDPISPDSLPIVSNTTPSVLVASQGTGNNNEAAAEIRPLVKTTGNGLSYQPGS